MNKNLINTGKKLEELYQKYNKREFVTPDPLQFLYAFPQTADRELVGFICALFAFGNVKQILTNIEKTLSVLGPHPKDFILNSKQEEMESLLKHIKHRWLTGSDLAKILGGLKNIVLKHQTIENCLHSHLEKNASTIVNALSGFSDELKTASQPFRRGLITSPLDGSACKRLFMFLRWMVRHDEVDPGGWNKIDPKLLIVPLDTHIFRHAKNLKLTKSNQANLKAAIEITQKFALLSPSDPIKYDFVMTLFLILK